MIVFWKIAGYGIKNGGEYHGCVENGECNVFPAPFAVFLNENDKNYVEPDISVICDKDKITDKGCYGAPDGIVEIVSPSSKTMDYFTKLFKYRTAGVREYWIVDPIKQRVTVYFFEKESVEEYSLETDIPVGIYEGLLLFTAQECAFTAHSVRT